MQDNSKIPEFETRSFRYKGIENRIVYAPELQVTGNGLDFTGKFSGIRLNGVRGTSSFQVRMLPDKILERGKVTPAKLPDFPHYFTITEFTYNGDLYKLAIIEVLFGAWSSVAELDFTGGYTCLLISEKTGTVFFELEPDGEGGWEIEDVDLEEGLMNQLGLIAEARRNGEQLTIEEEPVQSLQLRLL